MIELDELREQLELGELPLEWSPNTNISPGQFIPVVIEPVARKVSLYKWGLVPVWAKDPKIGYKMINARAETIAEKPSFKAAFLHRCLIPADGFYEWKGEGNNRHPYLFTMKDRKAFTFAGLWGTWNDQKGDVLNTCTIITTEPNELVSAYHDRMPVILGAEDRWNWLQIGTTVELKAMLKPFPSLLMAEPVQMGSI
jgi:putative SOS response-associated peptidase YedK